MTNRKELKEHYKKLKPDMGVFKIESRTSGNCFLFLAPDLKSLMNRSLFQLNMGSHPNRRLQNEWQEQGGNAFSIEVLERLEYDRSETKIDYSEELEILRLIWSEKLQGADQFAD